ncbi:YHYH protein [Neolewinella aurantiaca]|uniref:YHYH protein n=1 Tax=Neolewinella aurantiaca TaxID=2602767 RepID=A0A5C7FSH7_9BACT|nr:YHYH protein [Neolewinella aurantiaca]TXF87645.1 YHYH protein [Neolewinella aurantiaca]
MIRIFLTILVSVFYLQLSAHKTGHDDPPSRQWSVLSVTGPVSADFIRYEGDRVWLADENHAVVSYPFSEFSETDQNFITSKREEILSLNSAKMPEFESTILAWRTLGQVIGALLLAFSLVQLVKRKTKIYLMHGALGLVVITIASCSTGSGTTEHAPKVPANDQELMRSVFGAFPEVRTSTDGTYLYVSSDGLPDHQMMVGITNWQQQVPIDHYYTEDNSWAIPLQPRLSASPLSTKTNLLKGAIAIAANGIPIFNPLNNRGEDANAIGELDKYGGHCGRADDYHYHLPPTHLQGSVGKGKPIAYAVDGFPVYGETEDELDEYLGKFNADSSYQYHTIAEYPYFIAGMRGEVKLDPNSRAPETQVIPQARTQELRPALRPLRGAVITGFEKTGDKSYSLVYTLDGEQHAIKYGWDEKGLYTYKFIHPNGSTETETYQR